MRWSLLTGTILITLNCTMGALGIDSWPFSAYPTYSYVRSATVKYGWFLPQTATGAPLDLDKEAQALHFRKENLLPLAERMVDACNASPAELEAAVQQCWLRWRTDVPTLQAATSAVVVIREYPLDPDGGRAPVHETILGRLELTDGEWMYIPDTLSPR